MRKDKILFVFKRCEYNNNKILASENLSFLSIISFIMIIKLFRFIVKNKSNEDNSDINSSKDIKKKLTLTLKAFKERMIQKFDFFDIAEIDALTYYHLTRNKKNKLFSLIMNEIYDIFIKSFEVLSSIKRDNRISINVFHLYGFRIKI